MIVKQASVYFLLNVIAKLFPFIFLPVIASSLGPQAFAEYGTLLAISGLCAFFTSYSLDSGINYYFEKDRSSDSLLLPGMLWCIAISSVVYFSVSPFLFNALGYDAIEIALLLTLPLYITWNSILERLLRITGDLRRYLVTVLFRNFSLYTVIGGIMLWQNLEKGSLLFILSIHAAVLGLSSFLYLTRKHSLRSHRASIGEVIQYSLPLIPNKAIAFGIAPFIIFLANNYYSAVSVGLFIFAQTLGNGLNTITQAINNAISPAIFRKYQGVGVSGLPAEVYIPQIFYGIFCILSMIVCGPLVKLYAPEEFGDSAGLVEWFIILSWANFNKNLFLNLTMIDARKVRLVPYSTYLFCILAFSSIVILNKFGEVEIVIFSMILGRIASSMWLLVLSVGVRSGLPMILTEFIGLTLMYVAGEL